MKTLKYAILVAAIFLLTSNGAALDIETVLARGSHVATLPPTDSAILYHGTTFTIHEDGRMDRQEHIVRYLRNLHAWDLYGDPHLAFDSKRQELDVLISRTHTPDGKKVDTTPNGFNPIVPFGLDLAPDFTSYRQMVVTHLGIIDNSITELKYVISDKEPLLHWGWGDVTFGSNEPTFEREVILRTPKGSVLGLGSANGAPNAVSTFEGDYQVNTWKMTDLKNHNFAETGHRSANYLPRIQFTTCPSMEIFTKELEERFGKAAKACCSFADEIDGYCSITSEEMKLDSAISFIKDRIALKRFNDIGMLLRYRPSCRIYNTGYGNQADLSVLYATILKKVGFNPEVYLKGNSRRSVAGITGNETYMIRLDVSGTQCWMDPTSGEVSYHLPDDAVIMGIWPAREPQTMPSTPYENNLVRMDLEITFQDDGSAEGSVLVKTEGQLARFEKARTKDAEKFIADYTGGLFADPEIENARILYIDPKRVDVKADLTFSPVEETIDGILRVSPPWGITDVDGLLPHNLALHRPKRDVPVYLDHAGSIELNLKFRVPEEWETVLLPTTYEQKVPGLEYSRTVTNDNRTITFSEKVVFPQNRVSADIWESWRQVLLNGSSEANRTLLLQTEGS